LHGLSCIKTRWKNEKAVPHHTERRFSARQALGCLGRKGSATTATLTGVGIGNLESAGSQAVTEIDLGAAQVVGAKGVDQNSHCVHLAGQVIRPLLIEGHRVLHAGTPALLDVNPKKPCPGSPAVAARILFLRQRFL